MFKKNFRSLSVTTVLGLSLISVATGLSSCQDKDTYKIIAKQTDENCQETGSKQLLLYKNDQICSNNDVTWSINNVDASKIKIDQNGLLTWQNLPCNTYDFEVCARINEQKIVIENIALHVSTPGAIIGPTQLQGFYDQAGDSKQSYQLINEFGKPMEDVKWSVQEKGVDQSKIKFDRNSKKITWPLDLKIGRHDLIIEATRDHKTYQTKATLTITNNYSIHGKTFFKIGRNFESTEKSESGSENYSLFQNGQLSTHQDFIWDIEGLETKYKEKITIDSNGKLTWKDIVSDTHFQVIAKSKKASDRKLVSIIVRFDVKEYWYKIKGKTDYICCFGDAGKTDNFTFRVNNEQIQKKDVVWEIGDVSADSGKVTIDHQTGIVTWDGNVNADKKVVFRVWAFLKTDNDVVASTLCSVYFPNQYSIKTSSDKKTFTAGVGEKGGTDTTFVLMKGEDGNKTKAINYTTSLDNGKTFFYDQTTGQIKWTEAITEGQHNVSLNFYNPHGKECQVVNIVVNAIKGKITGQDKIEVQVDQDHSWDFKFDYENTDYTDQANWQIIGDNLQGTLSIASGKLTYKHHNEIKPNDYKIKIKAQHNQTKIWAEKEITLTILDAYHIEGDKELGVINIYQDDAYRQCDYVLKDGNNQTVNDVNWKVVSDNGDIINFLGIAEGKLCWDLRSMELNKDYSVYLEAWVNAVRCARIPIKFHTVGTFEQAPWSILSYICKHRNAEDVAKFFGFKSKEEMVGKTKKITFAGNKYDARVVALDHDNKKDGGKAPLTFELMQHLYDKNDELISIPWDSNSATNYRYSDIRKEIQDYSKEIELENEFTMTIVKKETVKGSLTKNATFDTTIEITDETGYVASLSEMTAEKFTVCTTYHEEDVFDYYRDVKCGDKVYLKYDLDGKLIDDPYYCYWLRSPFAISGSSYGQKVWSVTELSDLWPDSDCGAFCRENYSYYDGNIVLCFSV